jgi:hypothetical protein
MDSQIVKQTLFSQAPKETDGYMIPLHGSRNGNRGFRSVIDVLLCQAFTQ